MTPKPKPIRGAASRATTRSKSGDWLVQQPARSSRNINGTRRTHRKAGDQGVFGDRRVLKPGQPKPDASAYMFTEDRVIKEAARVRTFWKARIDEEDVEAYFNGLVKKGEWKFKVVAEKMAKLEKTLKRYVFWPASLKQVVSCSVYSWECSLTTGICV